MEEKGYNTFDCPQLEVNIINKQKFMTELAKLLAFMYEEDRQTALAMYERMFNDAADESALLQLLGSPTRQAVVIARVYNTKERKLQVESQSRRDDEESEDTPRFVLAIDSIYQKIQVKEPEERQVADGQFSLFGEDQFPIKPEEYRPFPGKAAAEPAEEAEVLTPPSEPEEELAEPKDEVDDFIQSMTILNSELPDPEERRSEPETGESEAPAGEPERLAAEPVKETEAETEADPFILGEPKAQPATVRKARPLALILFVILAVPVTIVGLVLLLIPTLASLGLAAGAISAGALALVGAFSGLPVFADILSVLGAALVILALGLLFLWLFIWFIGGAMAGLVRGIVNLGGQWCYKEVSA